MARTPDVARDATAGFKLYLLSVGGPRERGRVSSVIRSGNNGRDWDYG